MSVYIDTEKTDMRQFAFDTIQGITLPYWCDVKSPEEIIVKKVSGMIFGWILLITRCYDQCHF